MLVYLLVYLSVDICWSPRLVPDGPGWSRLVPDGPGWFRMVPAATASSSGRKEERGKILNEIRYNLFICRGWSRLVPAAAASSYALSSGNTG